MNSSATIGTSTVGMSTDRRGLEFTVPSSNLKTKGKAMTDSTVACPHCGKKFLNNPEAQGKTVKCPGCAQTFSFPAAPSPSPRRNPFDVALTPSLSSAPRPPAESKSRPQPKLANRRSANFGALETYSTICQVAGYVSFLAAGLFGILMALTAVSREPIIPFFSALCAVVFCALNGLVLFATSGNSCLHSNR